MFTDETKPLRLLKKTLPNQARPQLKILDLVPPIPLPTAKTSLQLKHNANMKYWI